MACSTAAATSPGLDFHVPNPTKGMEAPDGSLAEGQGAIVVKKETLRMSEQNKGAAGIVQ